MIGDGVNDVPALKRARMAVAMGSGSQITKGVADIVLLKDQFSRLPRAVAEGRRIARNIHRLGRLYVTKTVYAAALIAIVAVPGWAFPFLPRHLTLAAFLTIGIPSLRAGPGAQRRPPLPRQAAAGAGRVRGPGGAGDRRRLAGQLLPRGHRLRRLLEEGRTAATTTLVILGLGFILLLERGPGREHIAIQSYMLALVAALGALYALALAVEPLRDFFELTQLGGGQLFLALLSAGGGLVLASVVWRLPAIERLEEIPPPARTVAAPRPSEAPRMAAAAILDIDGTLVDTNYQHALAWFRASASMRSSFRSGGSTARSGWAATSSSRRSPATTSSRSRATTIRDAEGPLYMAMIEEVEPFEGASELLAELGERGHPVVLASSAKADEVEHYLDLLDARDLVDGWTTSADVEETKPEPDLVERRAREGGRRTRGA